MVDAKILESFVKAKVRAKQSEMIVVPGKIHFLINGNSVAASLKKRC